MFAKKLRCFTPLWISKGFFLYEKESTSELKGGFKENWLYIGLISKIRPLIHKSDKNI